VPSRRVVEVCVPAVVLTVFEACLPAPDVGDGGSSSAGDTQCTVWHPDIDGDGYGASSVTIRTCRPEPGWVRDDADCYDENADAHPDQEALFAVHRGDGMFDFDCDGMLIRETLEVGQCGAQPECDVQRGWAQGVADCGVTASYIERCSNTGLGSSCVPTGEEVTQRCR